MPVSMFTMSDWVSTATAMASSMRAESSVAGSVASPKITGTSSSAADRQKAVVGAAFDDHDVVARRLQVGHDPDAERAEADDDDVVAQLADLAQPRVLRDAPGQQQVGDERHQHGASTVTPANISPMPNSRSHVGWSMKLKSP